MDLQALILEQDTVAMRTLQKFMGKCVSFSLCVPAARLYIRATARAISDGSRRGGLIAVKGDLKREVAHWGFLQNFDQWIPWRSERHLVIELATDSSGYAWGACVEGSQFGDLWPHGDTRPIHLKEADALLHTIRSVGERLRDHRVDAKVDNMAVVKAWQHEGSRDPQLTAMLKQLFHLSVHLNIDLHLEYIPTRLNPADAPSRRLALQDTMLSPAAWAVVQDLYGPHSFDLMALDSNVMRDGRGQSLPHFTPVPLPGSSGVNVFAQELTCDHNYYVFPPFCMVAPLLRYFLTFTGKGFVCTMLVPDLVPCPPWWPLLQSMCVSGAYLARRGDTGFLLYPTRRGFMDTGKSLPHDLFIARLVM